MGPLTRCELEKIKAIMHEMLRYAQESNWHELNRADAERLAILTNSTEQSSTNEISNIPDFNSDYKSGYNSDYNSDSGTSHTTRAPLALTTNSLSSVNSALIDEITQLDSLIIETAQNSRNTLIKQNRELSAQVKAKQIYAKTSQIR